MKCSAIKINNSWIDVYKDPITDNVKKSKKGRLTLWHNNWRGYFTDSVNRPFDETTVEVLQPVYENGVLLKEYTFEEVRKNSSI